MAYRIDKPKNKERARKIPNEQWDSFRVRILHLWLHDGDEGRSLEDVAKILKREHNFVVTSAQLHNRLVKKWNVRKYITRNEWRRLYWDEMDCQPAETIRVYFNDRLITTERKKSEWERYSFASETRRPEGTQHKTRLCNSSTDKTRPGPPPRNFQIRHHQYIA